MDFNGQKKTKHLQIPLRFLRNKNFLNWLRSSESVLYLYLYSYVIRSDKVTNRIGKLIYNNYYRKNILAARWDQKTIAKELGFSENSVGYISRLLKNMVDKGIIIKHKDKLNRRSINIYEFGTHSGEPYKHETLHIFEYFIKLESKKKLATFLGGNRPLSWEEIGI